MRSIYSVLLLAFLLLPLAACGNGKFWELPSNGAASLNLKSSGFGVDLNTTTGDISLGSYNREGSGIYSSGTTGSGPGDEGKQIIDATRGGDRDVRSAMTLTRGDAGASLLEEEAGVRLESVNSVGFPSRAVGCAIYAAASDVDPASPSEC